MIALSVLFGMWLTCRDSKEPHYRNKPLTYWVKERAISGPAMAEAFAISRELASNAVPILVDSLEAKDSTVNRMYRVAWTNGPSFFTRRLPRPVEPHRIRRTAATMLGEMGTNAIIAVPALERALKDSDEGVQSRAGFALRRIKEPVPTVRPMSALSLEPIRNPSTNKISLGPWPSGNGSRTSIMRVTPK